jgi:hypothetical protein
MKISSDTMGSRSRDLPACSTVPQPTAPPRVPLFSIAHGYLCLQENYISSSVGQTQIDIRCYITLSQLDITVDFLTGTYKVCAADWCVWLRTAPGVLTVN